MGAEVIGQQVTINRVKIGGATLSKSMLSGIPVIDFADAMTSLVNGQLTVLARYPFQVFAKVKADIEKSLQVTLGSPSSNEIRQYAGRNELVGAVFYDSKSESLLQSWFIAGEYVTQQLQAAEKAYPIVKESYEAISAMDSFTCSVLQQAVRALGNVCDLKSIEREFEILLTVCVMCESLSGFEGLTVGSDTAKAVHGRSVLSRGRARRKSTPESMSLEETTSWYEGISSMSSQELQQQRMYPDIKDVDEEWLNDYLSGVLNGRSWVEQKHWIENAVYLLASDAFDRLRNEQRRYDKAMEQFRKSPIVLI